MHGIFYGAYASWYGHPEKKHETENNSSVEMHTETKIFAKRSTHVYLILISNVRQMRKNLHTPTLRYLKRLPYLMSCVKLILIVVYTSVLRCVVGRCAAAHSLKISRLVCRMYIIVLLAVHYVFARHKSMNTISKTAMFQMWSSFNQNYGKTKICKTSTKSSSRLAQLLREKKSPIDCNEIFIGPCGPILFRGTIFEIEFSHLCFIPNNEQSSNGTLCLFTTRTMRYFPKAFARTNVS